MSEYEDNDDDFQVDGIRGVKSPMSLSSTSSSANESLEGQYNFCRAVVSEFISNPADFLSRSMGVDEDSGEELFMSDFYIKTQGTESKKNFVISNPEVARFMPLNSIICHTPGRDKPVIAFPFFSQHFTMPIKPGEYVWVLKESIGGTTVFYWMSRVTGDRQSDDLNHTNIDRNNAIRNTYASFLNSGAITDPEDANLVAAQSSFTSPNAPVAKGVDYDKICAASIGYLEEFTTEPVPRKFKKCSDFLLQGSNNTAIQLTTEKFKEFDDSTSTVFANSTSTQNSANFRSPLAGTIDIVVGREKDRLKTLSELSTPEDSATSGNFNVALGSKFYGSQGLEHYETDKLDEVQGRSENKIEGLDDPRNVFARMYVSMDATPDSSFEFANEDFEHLEGASVISYGDLCRTYAEENIRIYNYAGNSLIDMSSDGSITLQTGQGDEAAKIVLKASGDIVIKPGTGGLLHLGGDEEETNVAVCGTPTTVATSGLALGTPIADTFGGTSFAGITVGGPTPLDGTGFTSTKVVMKIS